jgi:hypothetical protein
MPGFFELRKQRFVCLTGRSLPVLDALFDERLGHRVRQFRREDRIARVRHNLDDAAVPHGHYPYIPPKPAQGFRRGLKFRSALEVEFPDNRLEYGILLKQFRLRLYVRSGFGALARGGEHVAKIEKIIVERLNLK